MDKHLLEVKHLSIEFPNEGVMMPVVDDVNFSLDAGDITGIVGESGSGKSQTAMSVLGLVSRKAIRPESEIIFDGQDVLKLDRDIFKDLKGNEISIVFQEPMTSLNPVMKIGKQVEEPLKIHEQLSDQEMKARTLEALGHVGLKNPEEIYDKYPHELSGGMRQRVMIAMAIICRPKLLIADEPTTALDVTVQAQILRLLRKIHKETNMTILFISHDLNVIKELCDHVIVMYHGKIVERGKTEDVLYHPQHAYTKTLVASIPNNETPAKSCKDLVDIRHLDVFYNEKGQGIFAKSFKRHVLKDVSFSIREGEILGLVGESGCGKSSLAKTLVGLNKDYKGEIVMDQLHPQMVFQDPFASLNPAKKIGWIMEEPLRIAGIKDKSKRKELVLQMLSQIGLDESYANRYAHELSGGQRQRISIGCALINNSKLIIADEPVSALDVTISSQILKLLMEVHDKYQLTYLFISHDLNIVRHLCHRVIVMYMGEILEAADVSEIYEHPKHPYTQLLFDSILTGAYVKSDDEPLEVLDTSENEKDGCGCPFYSRCKHRNERCLNEKPLLKNIAEADKSEHLVKCHYI